MEQLALWFALTLSGQGTRQNIHSQVNTPSVALSIPVIINETVPPVASSSPIEVWSSEKTKSLISQYSAKYGVSEKVMLDVVACESGDMSSTTIQSRHIRPDGSREQSYGLVQIYLPMNPDVTYEQAVDPHFAIDFLARHLSKGNGSKWSCFRE